MLYLTPGDPAELLAGPEALKEAIDIIRHKYGLDQPIYTQYFMFIKNIFTGELVSLRYDLPVIEILMPRIINTLKIASLSIIIAVVIGIFAGVLSATHRYSWIDYISTVISLLGISMPSFLWAILLILLFAVRLELLPSGGGGGIEYIIMPATVLGTQAAAVIARMTRSTMLDVLGQDYITSARSAGLTERIVIYRHALRNTLMPTVTVIGLQFGFMLAGAVVTETVFAWPGVGRLLVTSILTRDFPVVQSALLVIAIMFVLVNLIVDVLYAYLDPRIRYG
jgi:ABC-type dipeptide/oligopeptide/nickel transport system permease component